MTESIDLDAYFDRIGYAGPRDASLRTLRELADLHSKTVALQRVSTP
jgi:N-hydroxyarylamine O-acetyltransferase